MSHLEEGRLQALLDGELSAVEAGELREHLASCVACGAVMRRTEETRTLISALLPAMDVAPPTERVRARLTMHRNAPGSPGRAPRPRLQFRRSDLARAALLLFGFAGAVAAAIHPASPLRRWLAPSEDPAAILSPATERAATSEPVREVGVRVAVVNRSIDVSLSDVTGGSSIEITWVENGAAAVYAPEGTSFTAAEAEGRVAARLAATGHVRVELPREVERASLVVDGVRYLVKTGERIDFPGPAALVEGSGVSFRVP